MNRGLLTDLVKDISATQVEPTVFPSKTSPEQKADSEVMKGCHSETPFLHVTPDNGDGQTMPDDRAVDQGHHKPVVNLKNNVQMRFTDLDVKVKIWTYVKAIHHTKVKPGEGFSTYNDLLTSEIHYQVPSTTASNLLQNARNKDVEADLKCRNLSGQFPSSRLEDKRFSRWGVFIRSPLPKCTLARKSPSPLGQVVVQV
ncbi:hypothetical protein HanPI659440_Chr17g0679831 [Helianthus annuus]|nr:hypothetical protein HanPI659440_Chr17g0679831 [Helianthus annuus]